MSQHLQGQLLDALRAFSELGSGRSLKCVAISDGQMGRGGPVQGRSQQEPSASKAARSRQSRPAVKLAPVDRSRLVDASEVTSMSPTTLENYGLRLEHFHSLAYDWLEDSLVGLVCDARLQGGIECIHFAPVTASFLLQLDNGTAYNGANISSIDQSGGCICFEASFP